MERDLVKRGSLFSDLRGSEVIDGYSQPEEKYKNEFLSKLKSKVKRMYAYLVDVLVNISPSS